jgi:hypothetical protein
MRHDNIMNTASYIILSITGVFIIIALIGLIYPYRTIDFYDFKITSIETRQANTGYIVTASWSFQKYIHKPTSYSISLIPIHNDSDYISTIYILESGSVNSDVGFHKSQKAIKISEEIPRGCYQLSASLTYQVNPIRQITRTFVTKNTLVIP